MHVRYRTRDCCWSSYKPDKIEKYLSLYKQVTIVREKNHNRESAEEDEILDKMDDVWDDLNENDREEVERRIGEK